jgi:hypothetical protein
MVYFFDFPIGVKWGLWSWLWWLHFGLGSVVLHNVYDLFVIITSVIDQSRWHFGIIREFRIWLGHFLSNDIRWNVWEWDIVQLDGVFSLLNGTFPDSLVCGRCDMISMMDIVSWWCNSNTLLHTFRVCFGSRSPLGRLFSRFAFRSIWHWWTPQMGIVAKFGLKIAIIRPHSFYLTVFHVRE